MKLLEADREFLRCNYGEDDCHIDQIQEAIGKSTFECDGKKVSAAKVIELSGRKAFLAAMDRSAFHRTASVQCEGHEIYVDSSRLFRGC